MFASKGNARIAVERVPQDMDNLSILDQEHLPHPEAAVRELPVPNGSSMYSGWWRPPKDWTESIRPSLAPDGERISLCLRVKCFEDQWSGLWEIPNNSKEHLHMELVDETHLIIRNVVGNHRTELHASVTAGGILHGETVQDGMHGGSFRLWPMVSCERTKQPASCGLANFFAAKVPTRGIGFSAHDPKSTPKECSICMEDFLAGEILKRTSCSGACAGHVFHQQCLDKWLEEHYTCPMCRQPLKEPVTSADPGLRQATFVYTRM